MTSIEKFEQACQKIKERDGVSAYKYDLQGRKRDPGVTLNSGYRPVAVKYLYFEHLKEQRRLLYFHGSRSRMLA